MQVQCFAFYLKNAYILHPVISTVRSYSKSSPPSCIGLHLCKCKKPTLTANLFLTENLYRNAFAWTVKRNNLN